MYKIVYTPLFQRDLNEILDYITGQLKNANTFFIFITISSCVYV